MNIILISILYIRTDKSTDERQKDAYTVSRHRLCARLFLSSRYIVRVRKLDNSAGLSHIKEDPLGSSIEKYVLKILCTKIIMSQSVLVILRLKLVNT